MGILAYGKVHRLLWSHVLVERKQPFHECKLFCTVVEQFATTNFSITTSEAEDFQCPDRKSVV